MVYILAAASLLALWLIIRIIVFLGFRQMTQMRLYSYPQESLSSYLLRTGTFTQEKYAGMTTREVQTLSRDGLSLNGQLFIPHPQSKRWGIFVHGYTMSLRASLQFAAMFEEKGFNLLLIDQRRHGKSQGKYTTYGFREKYDIDSWVNWLLQEYGPDLQIALHGQSLGGGTVLEYLSMAPPAVKLAVADCAYSDLDQLIRYQIRSFAHLPSFPFIGLVNRHLEARAGFRLDQVKPLKSVAKCEQPVLFIHGEADRYVPPAMSKAMYDAKSGPKELVLIPGATHAVSYTVNPKKYKEAVHAFIDEYMKEEPQRVPIYAGTGTDTGAALQTQGS